MDSQQYYLNSFSHDVSRMKLREGSPFVKYLLLNDEHATFFGGVQWENCEKDLKKIALENKPSFVINLFFMVMTGYTLEKYYPKSYQVYRSLTRFPLFGAEKEGDIYLVHPIWILTKPLKAGIFLEQRFLQQLSEMLPRFKLDFQSFSVEYLEALSFQSLVQSFLHSFPEEEKGKLYSRLEIILRE